MKHFKFSSQDNLKKVYFYSALSGNTWGLSLCNLARLSTTSSSGRCTHFLLTQIPGISNWKEMHFGAIRAAVLMVCDRC